MQEKESNDTNVKATIEAVTGLVTAIPVYQDGLQPSVQQIGKSLETVTKTVNIVLSPIKALVWGYEQIEQYITKRVSEKLKDIPEENIVTPPAIIAGPAIESLRFCGDDINLRELYANLLASSMDINTQDLILPSYVEILKNLSSDEALLLQIFITNESIPLIDIHGDLKEQIGSRIKYRNFSHINKIVNLKRPDLIPTYLDNICRLGILAMPFGKYLVKENAYEPLESDTLLDLIKQGINDNDEILRFERKVVMRTTFGTLFINNVVKEKN